MRTLLYTILIVTGSCMVPLTSLAQTTTHWSGTITGGAAAGQVILDGDVNLTGTVTVAAGNTLTLDLNGHVLKGNFTASSDQYMLNVEKGATLNVTDSGADALHTGYVNEKGVFVLDAARQDVTLSGGCMMNSFVSDTRNTKGISVSGTLVMSGGTIAGCHSIDIGAAVTVASSGTVVMSGGCIAYNYTAGTDKGTRAGAVYGEPGHTTGGSNLSFDGTRFIGNRADGNGGAVCAYLLRLDNCTFEKNTTALRGGAVYMRYDSDSPEGSLTIANSTFVNNYAVTFGGAVDSTVPTVITGSVIKDNWAMKSEPEEGPKANLGRGGGIHFTGKGGTLGAGPEFILDGTEVTGNAAMYYGGGIQVDNGGVLRMRGGSRVDGNTAILHGAGGVHVTGSATFIFESGFISGNTAHSVGGGIHSSYGCRLELSGGTIADNIVYGRGGGIHVNVGGELTLNGTDVTGNLAYQGLDYKYSIVSEENGIYKWSSPQTGEESATVQGYGGGVVVDAGTCTMSSGSLSGNWAADGGGGIALVMMNTASGNNFSLNRVVSYTLQGGVVADNTTDGDGAGIYLMRNRLSSAELGTEGDYLDGQPHIAVTGGRISGNKAERNGGAAYQDNDTQFRITGDETLMQYNTAGESGGAVYILYGTATIENGHILDNTAGKNGGAFYVNGDVTMTGGEIIGNRADNGGGICIVNGTFSGGGVLDADFSVSGNKAGTYGGGLYVSNTEDTSIEVKFDGGNLTDNSARAGGGVAVNGYVSLTTDKTSIFGNTAVNGGGIYMTGTSSANPAAMTFGQGMIYNNTATAEAALPDGTAWHGTETAVSGVGGGIFLDAWSSLSFDVNEVFGLYGNTAENAADDIFASGVGTKVVLPEVKDMNLTDFNIPAGELFWTEDYTENDTRYRDGLAGIATDINDPAHNLRYDYALYRLKRGHIAKVAAQTLTDTYTCLTLGYEIYLVTVERQGLKKGESAVFRIISSKQDPEAYIMLTLTGIDDTGTTVSRRLALPDGSWRVEEVTPWAWSYNHPDGAQSATTITDETVFRFTGSKREAVPMHHEGIDRAVMALPK